MQKTSNGTYKELVEKLSVGVTAIHTIYGKGIVTEVDKRYVRIKFGQVLKKFNLEIVANGGKLKVESFLE